MTPRVMGRPACAPSRWSPGGRTAKGLAAAAGPQAGGSLIAELGWARTVVAGGKESRREAVERDMGLGRREAAVGWKMRSRTRAAVVGPEVGPGLLGCSTPGRTLLRWQERYS